MYTCTLVRSRYLWGKTGYLRYGTVYTAHGRRLPYRAGTGLNVTYHSTHGALQESRHVFTGAGLLPLSGQHQRLHIFEMGFGTGLNALLTLQEAIGRQQAVIYHAIELYPLPAAELQALNYTELLPGSLFVTYCSKGVVRRALRSAGFRVEKLPGPPGKREILRATRPL